MSSIAIRTNDPSVRSPKCRSSRHKLHSLISADLGPANRGLITDVNKGGMAFEGIHTVEAGSEISLRFKLPGTEESLETTARVVWVNDVKKGGGLAFINLPDGIRRRINRWLSQIEPAPTIDKAMLAAYVEPKLLPAAPKFDVPADNHAQSVQPTEPPVGRFYRAAEMAARNEAAPAPARSEQPAPAILPSQHAAPATPSSAHAAPATPATPSPAHTPAVLFALPESKREWVMPVTVGLVIAAIVIALCFAIPAIIAGQIDESVRGARSARFDFGAPKPPKYSLAQTVPSDDASKDASSSDRVAENREPLTGPAAIATQGSAR